MKIFIENKPLDTDEKTIKLLSNSPIFNEVSGDSAYDITVPSTPNNKKILGYPHRTTVGSNISTSFPAILVIGTIRKNGIALVKEAGNRYTLSLGFNNSDFYFLIQKKTLKDIDYGQPLNLATPFYHTTSVVQDWNRSFISGLGQHHSDEAYINLGSDNSYTENEFAEFNGTKNKNSIFIKKDGKYKISYHCFYKFVKGYGKLSVYINGVPDGSIYLKQTKSTLLLSHTFEKYFKKSDSISFYIWVSLENIIFRYESEFEILLNPEAGYSQMITIESVNSGELNHFYQKKYPEVPFCLAPVYNSSLFSNLLDENIKNRYENLPIQNIFDTTKKEFPIFFYQKGILNANIFSPFPYVAFIFDSIAQNFGYTIRKNIFLNSELSQLVLYNTFVHNYYSTVDVDKRFMISDNWELKDSMPNMLLKDFFSILNLFAAKMFVDNRKKIIDIVFIKDILEQEIEEDQLVNLTEKPKIMYSNAFDGYTIGMENSDPFLQKYDQDLEHINIFTESVDTLEYLPSNSNINDCYFISSENAYYYYTFDTENLEFSWKIYSFSKTKLEKKGEKNEYQSESKIGILSTRTGRKFIEDFEYTLDGSIATYALNEIAISQAEGVVKNAIETINDDIYSSLTFYRGVMPSSNEKNERPFLSSDVYGDNGVKLDDSNIALKWDGEYGLYQKFWKPVLDFIINRAKPIQLSVAYMTTTEFARLSFTKKQDINDHILLLSRIEGDASSSGVYNVILEGYLI